MAIINIQEETRKRINKLVLKAKLKAPKIKNSITQDTIVCQALDYLESVKNE